MSDTARAASQATFNPMRRVGTGVNVPAESATPSSRSAKPTGTRE